MRVSDRTYRLHLGGKIEVQAKVPIKTRDDLSMAYTPGVARVCRSIHDDPDAAFALTIRRNTRGRRHRRLGRAGAGRYRSPGRAAGHGRQGHALQGVRRRRCLSRSASTRKTPRKSSRPSPFLAPTFGGINLEDISSPRCVEIEERLTERLDIPVFHDDQHGTAIVVLAALHNALKVVEKKHAGHPRGDLRGGRGGAGHRPAAASGGRRARSSSATAKGAIYQRPQRPRMNPVKQWLAENTNPEQLAGTLGDAMAGADVFIGVASADLITVEDVKTHGPRRRSSSRWPIPTPKSIPTWRRRMPAVVASGRSDYANQINNVLCFPGLFRGMLDVRAAG